jgi:hypothetical protein
MATKLTDFLRDNVAGKPLRFRPYCDLREAADALMVFFRPDSYYSKRLTDHVTLYLATDTPDLIVGCRIKGISGILDDLPNYISINDSGVKLKLIFLSFRGGAEDDKIRNAFNELAKEAGDLELTSAE